jgi:hypothetical protein
MPLRDSLALAAFDVSVGSTEETSHSLTTETQPPSRIKRGGSHICSVFPRYLTVPFFWLTWSTSWLLYVRDAFLAPAAIR